MESSFERMRFMFQEASVTAYAKLVNILPEAAAAIVIVVVGLLVASLAYYLCRRILEFFAVDKLVGKTPLDRMLKGIGILKSVSDIIALLIFWLAVLVTLVFASEILHLEQVSGALSVVTRYIPQVIAALLIIVFGMLLAKFLQTIVSQAVARSGVGYERSIGKGVHVLVLVFVFLAASQQLGFDLSFVTTNMMIFIAVLILIIGIGIVVSLRTIIENTFACRHIRRHLSPGQRITLEHIEGTVRSFTLTDVVLDTKGGRTVIPATFFFKHSYTIAS